jgi:polar amino acid transport system substrate-binding protein
MAGLAKARGSRASYALRIFAGMFFVLASGSSSAADLRIAYNSQWYPYSYGEAGEVRGIMVELLENLLGERLGYQLRHRGYPWSRAQHYVEQGEEDALFTYPSDQRLQYTRRAESDVFKVESRAFVRRNSMIAAALAGDPDIARLGDARVCVMLGDNWSENFYREQGIPFEYGRDTLNCLDQVANDRADLFVHATASTLANIELAGLGERIDMLPAVYSSIPLTLLIGNGVAGSAELRERFDALLREMQADGSLQALVERLRNANWPAIEPVE